MATLYDDDTTIEINIVIDYTWWIFVLSVARKYPCNGTAQDYRKSSALAIELLQVFSCDIVYLMQDKQAYALDFGNMQ